MYEHLCDLQFTFFLLHASSLEKRQKYDNGEDPLDPESQQGQGFNPFAQGFHGHHGGDNDNFGGFGDGFNFKFHFN